MTLTLPYSSQSHDKPTHCFRKGSLTCLSNTSPDITPVPMVNGVGVAAKAHPDGKPGLISNGMPSTMVHCREPTERSLANGGVGVPNGHVSPVQDSPFIGYIIAMHRKMVGTTE